MLILGVELDQLQVENQPLRPQRLLEHCHCFSWWFPLRFRRKGKQPIFYGILTTNVMITLCWKILRFTQLRIWDWNYLKTSKTLKKKTCSKTHLIFWQDCKAMLWDLNDGKHLHTLDHNDIITALCFSPNRYWLCAAFGPSIKIWDLESKDMVEELRPELVSQSAKAEPPQCLSLAWSTDGQTLFAGYTDNTIRVWQVSVSAR